MSTQTEVREGWTTKLPFTLTTDGAVFNATGFTLSACYLTGRDGTAVVTTGKFNWTTAAIGLAYFKPGASDLLAAKSPYRITFQVTDGNGDIVLFPNGESNEIIVRTARE